LGLASEKTGTNARTYYTRDDKAKLLSMRTSGGSYYYLTDAIGSVVAVTGPNGNRVGTGNYRYDPYGNLIGGDPLNGTGVNSPFRFAGGYFDSESGFLKFGTRYYDPSVARWAQQGPAKGRMSDPLSLNPWETTRSTASIRQAALTSATS
jgi:RHS repeat-associated protein